MSDDTNPKQQDLEEVAGGTGNNITCGGTNGPTPEGCGCDRTCPNTKGDAVFLGP